MVYRKLEIVLGAVVSYGQLKEIFNVTDPYDIPNHIYNKRWYENSIRILTFPCCSDSAQKLFIVGFVMHKYYRKYSECDNCAEYTCCDDCFGKTNNGHYDIDKIFNSPTEVNIRHVCLRCYDDNRVDLMAPSITTDYKTYCADANKSLELACKTCNLKHETWRTPTDYLKFHEHRYGIVSKFLKTNDIESDIKLYYMIDDCTSCT